MSLSLIARASTWVFVMSFCSTSWTLKQILSYLGSETIEALCFCEEITDLSVQATNISIVLDLCSPKIITACDNSTNSTDLDIIDECKNDWDVLKKKTTECEGEAGEKDVSTNCTCWQNVNNMKTSFQAKCYGNTSKGSY